MKPVTLHDPVYGTVTFADPLLIELYHSAAIQRLAGIYQAGITVFRDPARTTRLDHSVGVAALLARLNAGLEEQAAGLIHDAPHTAFSHVVDFAFPNAEHTYHEVHREAVLAASDLPTVLKRHGLDWTFISEAENFSLLEQPLPLLCADRLDYFLRDGLSFGTITPAEVEAFLAELKIVEGRIVVDGIEPARWLGDNFILLDDDAWCSVLEVGWYTVMGQALREAIQGGVIAEADLWGTDETVMAKLRDSEHPGVQRWLEVMQPGLSFIRDDANPELMALPKVRAVDPPVLFQGSVQPLSILDPEFAHRRTAYIAGKQGRWGLKIIHP